MATVKVSALFLCLLLFTTATAQQSDNGSLAGTVTDQNKLAVPNATITVTNLGTGRTRAVTTNEEGRWTVTVLALGEYEVKAEAANFKSTTQKARVSAANTTNVDLTLGIEEIKNEVTVVAQQGSSTILEGNSSPATGSTLTGVAIEKAPAANRSAFSLLATDSSISTDLTDPLTNGTGNPETSINGGRTTSVGVQKDGVDATNLTGTGS